MPLFKYCCALRFRTSDLLKTFGQVRPKLKIIDKSLAPQMMQMILNFGGVYLQQLVVKPCTVLCRKKRYKSWFFCYFSC